MAVVTGTAAGEPLNGTAGNVTGGGNDTITVGTGSDVIEYFIHLNDHDVVIGFDDNAAGGQAAVDADGIAGNGFEVTLATLKTADAIAVGQDVIVGD